MVAPTELMHTLYPGVQGPQPLVGEGVRESREPRGNINVPQPFGLSIVPVHLLTAGVLWPWRSGPLARSTSKAARTTRLQTLLKQLPQLRHALPDLIRRRVGEIQPQRVVMSAVGIEMRAGHIGHIGIHGLLE